MNSICSHKQTAKQKLADLRETAEVDKHLIKHYERILANFEEMTAKLDEEIAVIEKQKEELLKKFIEAPEQLINLNKHLAEIVEKMGEVKDAASGKIKKINRLKNLRQRLAKMEKEFKDDGVNVEELLNNMD